MRTVSKNFHRLDPEGNADAIVESGVLKGPEALVAKVRPSDGIVLAAWDPDGEQGRVHALGIVEAISGQEIAVDWRRVNFTLRPTSQGAIQWRMRSSFRFVDLVAERYGLSDRFHDAFALGSTRVSPRSAPTAPVPSARTTPSHPQGPVTAAAAPTSSAPQCNRVTPTGEIIATRARGTFMGNRTSPPRWLICDLHFKRDLKEPRKYVKLFFLDEAVALAAGHRPCNTCRHERYQTYLATVKTEFPLKGAADIDRLLNTARTSERVRSPVDSLPDGAFVQLGADDYRLKWSGALHKWTPEGYVGSIPLTELNDQDATVLTPGLTIVALRHGYLPAAHESVSIA